MISGLIRKREQSRYLLTVAEKVIGCCWLIGCDQMLNVLGNWLTTKIVLWSSGWERTSWALGESLLCQCLLLLSSSGNFAEG